MRDLFRVAFIHLAAVGFNEKLGHGRRNNTRARAPRYGFATMSILRWRSKASGKWICVQPLSHFSAGPRIRPEFIEKSHADDSDVLVLRYFWAAYDSRTGPKRNAATASVLCRK